MDRRGFLASLAGSLLGGKILGPLNFEPTAELWKAAPSLAMPPVLNSYVPLETVCAEALKIVERELKWLRLRYLNHVPGYYRTGPAITFRLPAPFIIPPLKDPYNPTNVIVERCAHLTFSEFAVSTMDLQDADICRPLQLFNEWYTEPAAWKLAEEVIQGVRRHGGAEYMASLKMSPAAAGDFSWGVLRSTVMESVLRSTVMESPETGMVLRATEVRQRTNGWHPVIHLDMTYGLA